MTAAESMSVVCRYREGRELVDHLLATTDGEVILLNRGDPVDWRHKRLVVVPQENEGLAETAYVQWLAALDDDWRWPARRVLFTQGRVTDSKTTRWGVPGDIGPWSMGLLGEAAHAYCGGVATCRPDGAPDCGGVDLPRFAREVLGRSLPRRDIWFYPCSMFSVATSSLEHFDRAYWQRVADGSREFSRADHILERLWFLLFPGIGGLCS